LACKRVEILKNIFKAIQKEDIAEMNSVVYFQYHEFDKFMKMVYVQGHDSIEVTKTGLFAGSTTYLFGFFWHFND
jgi:hypothetical protein